MLVIDEDEWSSSKLGLVDMLVNHGVGVERLHFLSRSVLCGTCGASVTVMDRHHREVWLQIV